MFRKRDKSLSAFNTYRISVASYFIRRGDKIVKALDNSLTRGVIVTCERLSIMFLLPKKNAIYLHLHDLNLHLNTLSVEKYLILSYPEQVNYTGYIQI